MLVIMVSESNDWVPWFAIGGMAVLVLSYHWLSRLNIERRLYLSSFVIAAFYCASTVVLGAHGYGGWATFSFVLALLHLGKGVGQYRSRVEGRGETSAPHM
jgi:hypothetical protein